MVWGLYEILCENYIAQFMVVVYESGLADLFCEELDSKYISLYRP